MKAFFAILLVFSITAAIGQLSEPALKRIPDPEALIGPVVEEVNLIPIQEEFV